MFKTISFSQFIRARKCMSSAIKPSYFLGKKSKSFYTKKQVVGFLFHEIKEKNSGNNLFESIENFQMFLADFKRRYESKFDFDSVVTIDSWEEVSAIAGYMLDVEDSESSTEFKPYREEEFFSDDQLVTARPDLVLANQEKTLLYDFKSGSLLDANQDAKEEYIIQLHFYAGVLNDNFSQFPDTSYLESYKEGVRKLNIDFEYSQSILGEAKKILHSLNKTFNEGNLTSKFNENSIYDFETCRFCSSRSICKKYLDQNDNHVSQKAVSFSGSVLEIDHPENAKFGTIKLGLDEKQVLVHSVPSKYISYLETGTMVCLYDLSGSSTLEYNFLPWSKVDIYES